MFKINALEAYNIAKGDYKRGERKLEGERKREVF